MRSKSLILLVYLFAACDQVNKPQSGGKSKLNGDNNGTTTGFDTTGFFVNCNKLVEHSYQGALQGIKRGKDSTNFLCFATNFDKTPTFEIIFVMKGGVNVRKELGYKSIWESFQKGCVDSFNDFDCFAFVVPMRDPEKQEDIHAMNIDFPINVKIYNRISNDKWRFIEEFNAINFEEYSTRQFQSIYYLD